MGYQSGFLCKLSLLLLAFSLNTGISYANIQNQGDYSLYFSLGNNYKFTSQNYLEELSIVDPTFKTLSIQYDFRLVKGITINEETLLRMEKSGQDLTGTSSNVSKLRQILKVVFSDDNSNGKINELAQKIKEISLIDYCAIVSNHPINPPSDIFPTTINLESNQGYIESNPGVNMRYAWNLGTNGAGIKIRDIEYGFNKSHEEFNDRNIFIAPGMNVSPDADNRYTDHGTYVSGIVYGDKGNYGISGLAYGSDEVLVFPEWQQSGYDRVNAISQAIGQSTVGDILIYEMQLEGQNNRYVPAEFNPVVWDLTKAATDSGLVIVAAAGNGGENLDLAYYQEYNARGDSGAIIVGSGHPDLTHEKYATSTYGSRVNVQGWAYSVYSSGYYYGSATLFGNDINQSYANFNSTSAATAIVSSCAVVLQSYYKSITGNNLTSQQLRSILIQSGIPQGSATAAQHIGPLPNMQAAISEINNSYLSNDQYRANSVVVYPNPSEDLIYVSTMNPAKDLKANLYGMDGKIIIKDIHFGTNNPLNIESLSEGIYMLELLMDGNKKVYKKIIKQ